jgi:hypothetical protein
MADRNNRIGLRQWVVRQPQATKLLGARDSFACQLEHGRRGVCRHDAVARFDEVARQRARAAAELEDETFPLANRLEQRHDARCASVGMEPVPEVVHEGEIAPVVRLSGDVENVTRVRFPPPPLLTVPRSSARSPEG